MCSYSTNLLLHNIFKREDELKDFFDVLNQSMKYDKNQIDPSDAMEAIGIDITDEFDKPIEFDDSPEGIK